MSWLRALVILLAILIAWRLLVFATDAPAYILPPPEDVVSALWKHRVLLAPHALTTLGEILLGLMLGSTLGSISALLLSYFRSLRRWLLPVLVASQAIPVFALAPLLVLWMGYGIGSKVAMATLIIYFPVAASFFDGLRRTAPGWIELARVMGASPVATLRLIRVPSALPALASGLRIAAAVAPIGAVVGEWVGASQGLGYLMLHANARLQIDLLFAALIVLAAMAVLLYATIDRILRMLISWQADTSSQEG